MGEQGWSREVRNSEGRKDDQGWSRMVTDCRWSRMVNVGLVRSEKDKEVQACL